MEANIVVLGTENVGKSALTVRLLTRRFIGEYGHIESIYSQSFALDDRALTLNVWDSPHSQVDPPLFQKKLLWADAFVLVYSICDRSSFNSVRGLVRTIRASRAPPGAPPGAAPTPIAIVGNKRDLQHRRTVPSREGQLLALDTDCHFYEASAAEGHRDVLRVFQGLVDRVKVRRGPPRRGFRGIVKSMSAVFARRRTDSL